MKGTLHRREFLGLVAAAVAAGDLRGAANGAGWRPQSAGSRQKFRIGHNLTTYISGGRGPDGFWKGVGEIAGLGVRGTEADDNPSQLTATYGSAPGEVKDRLAKHGMTLVAIYHTLPVSDPVEVPGESRERVACRQVPEGRRREPDQPGRGRATSGGSDRRVQGFREARQRAGQAAAGGVRPPARLPPAPWSSAREPGRHRPCDGDDEPEVLLSVPRHRAICSPAAAIRSRCSRRIARGSSSCTTRTTIRTS